MLDHDTQQRQDRPIVSSCWCAVVPRVDMAIWPAGVPCCSCEYSHLLVLRFKDLASCYGVVLCLCLFEKRVRRLGFLSVIFETCLPRFIDHCLRFCLQVSLFWVSLYCLLSSLPVRFPYSSLPKLLFRCAKLFLFHQPILQS